MDRKCIVERHQKKKLLNFMKRVHRKLFFLQNNVGINFMFSLERIQNGTVLKIGSMLRKYSYSSPFFTLNEKKTS